MFVYVKAALTDELPFDTRAYAEAHLDFPQESTADQFFDEAQFEAYETLGEHLGERVTAVLEGVPQCKAVMDRSHG